MHRPAGSTAFSPCHSERSVAESNCVAAPSGAKVESRGDSTAQPPKERCSFGEPQPLRMTRQKSRHACTLLPPIVVLKIKVALQNGCVGITQFPMHKKSTAKSFCDAFFMHIQLSSSGLDNTCLYLFVFFHGHGNMYSVDNTSKLFFAQLVRR